MNRPEDILDELMTKKYKELKKKYKQFCFLNGYYFDEDVLSDTYLKVKEIILKKGLRDETEKGIEDYFFKAFKKNTFLAFQNLTKAKIKFSDNIYETYNNIPNSDTTERIEKERYDEFVRNYLLNIIQLHFDSLSCRVWRLKRFVTINQKQLTYEQVRQMTHIIDAKKRVIAIDRWLKANVKKKDIDNEYNKLCLSLKC